MSFFKHNIYPFEIKNGKNYTLSSLKKIINKFPAQLCEPIVFHEGEFKEEDGITYLPIIMAMCL